MTVAVSCLRAKPAAGAEHYDVTHTSSPSRWLGAQTADSDCDWLKRFTAVLAFCFSGYKTVFETV